MNAKSYILAKFRPENIFPVKIKITVLNFEKYPPKIGHGAATPLEDRDLTPCIRCTASNDE